MSDIEDVADPIGEVLDELALLCEAWQKNRDRGRPSPVLKGALILAARDVTYQVEFFEEAERQKSQSG